MHIHLSPEAQKAKDEAAARWRFRKTTARIERAQMERGPRLEGTRVVIPSNWYDEEARAFWKSIGAFWVPGDPEANTWVVDTRRPYKGKRYTRWAWLRSVRRRYYELYPELSSFA